MKQTLAGAVRQPFPASNAWWKQRPFPPHGFPVVHRYYGHLRLLVQRRVRDFGDYPYTPPYRTETAVPRPPSDCPRSLRSSWCAVSACHRPLHRPGGPAHCSLQAGPWQASPSGDRLAPGRDPTEPDYSLEGLTMLQRRSLALRPADSPRLPTDSRRLCHPASPPVVALRQRGSGYRVNEPLPELTPFIQQVHQNLSGRTPWTPWWDLRLLTPSGRRSAALVASGGRLRFGLPGSRRGAPPSSRGISVHGTERTRVKGSTSPGEGRRGRRGRRASSRRGSRPGRTRPSCTRSRRG